MASRFYFPSGGSPAVTPTINDGGEWLHVNGTNRRPFSTTVGSTALNTDIYTPDADDSHIGVDGNSMHCQYVCTDTLAAQTIAAQAVKWQFQTLEGNTNNNMFLAIKIFLVSQDGTTIKETLLALKRDATEIPITAYQNRGDSSTTTAVDSEAGDRLVIEVGAGGQPSAGTGTNGHNSQIRFGEVASSGDLPENNTEAGATFRPWLEFANTLSFVAGPLADSSVALPLAGSAAATHPVNAVTSKALPLGGSAAATHPVTTPPLGFRTITHSGDNTDKGFTTPYQTAVVTLHAGRGYLLFVIADQSNGPSVIETAGGALAFTLLDSVGSGQTWLEVWGIAAAGSTVTAAINIITTTDAIGCLWYLAEWNGHDNSPFTIQIAKTSAAGASSIVLTPAALGAVQHYQLAAWTGNANSTADVPSGTSWSAVGTGYAQSGPARFLEVAENTSGVATQLTGSGAGSADRLMVIVEINDVAAALPLGGSATGAVGDAAVSTKALPLAGTAAATVGHAASSTRALPLGGSATGLLGPAPISAASNQALPLAGTAAATHPVTVAHSKPLPLGGSATGVVSDAPVISAVSVQPLPLAGSVTAVVSLGIVSVAALPLGGSATGDTGATGDAWEPGSWVGWGDNTWVGMGGEGAAEISAESVQALPLGGSATLSIAIGPAWVPGSWIGWGENTWVGMEGALAERFAVSVCALPLAGAAAATVANQIVTVKALPLTGVATAKVGTGVVSTRALPLGGSLTVRVGVRASSTKALPLSGSASAASSIGIASNARLPLAGTPTATVSLSAQSTARLPLGGSATAQLGITATADTGLPLPMVVTATGTVSSGIVSVARLPLGGSATAIQSILAESVAALPLGGALSVAVAITVQSSAPLPLTGAASSANENTAQSIAPLPLGGSITIAPHSFAVTTARLPLGGLLTVAVLIRASSTRRLPLGGSATILTTDQPEVDFEDLSGPSLTFADLSAPSVSFAFT